MSVLAQLKVLLKKQRAYASFFKGGDKVHEEIAVVRDLLDAMTACGESRFTEACASAGDPPDCVAKDADGSEVAIEVTEIVCEETVELTLSGTETPSIDKNLVWP